MISRYRSRIDSWLAIMMLLGAVISVAAAIYVLSQRVSGGLVIAAFISLIGAGLPVWILVGTTYRIDGRQLLVRSGPFRWNIDLKELKSIEPTRSMLSSPALSLDRLRISYGAGRSCIVSPADQQGFIAAVRKGAEADA